MSPTDTRYAPAKLPQAAPGVLQHNATAVNSAQQRPLYTERQKVYPKLAHGPWRSTKWAVMGVTLAIYYLLPWLRWSRGPDLPDQAVLLDLPHNRFFFFFLEIWPQEFYFVTGLLVLAALSLFLITAIAGRVWCGYACPQTVWTDLMIVIERFWQGDRNARKRLDKAKWGPAKIFKKTMTHLCWLAVGMLTGGAFVFYFRDAPTLARELATGSAPAIAYLFLGLFTATTYVLGGIAREQVCIYMCPWPRIQGAMVDHRTLFVSYLSRRGEPRGAHKKNESWDGRGDCIDCKACVAVCPMGIDIRDGAQLECIQCALCIDACNDIMGKIGRPKGLIGYYSIASEKVDPSARRAHLKLLRPRTLAYAGLLALVSCVLLVAWLQRSTLEINVLHERNPPYVLLSDGSIRNAYTVKILNKLQEPREVSLAVKGLPGAELAIAGAPAATLKVPTDDLRQIRVLVTLPAREAARLANPSIAYSLTVSDIAGKHVAERVTLFQQPVRQEQQR